MKPVAYSKPRLGAPDSTWALSSALEQSAFCMVVQFPMEATGEVLKEKNTGGTDCSIPRLQMQLMNIDYNYTARGSDYCTLQASLWFSGPKRDLKIMAVQQ